MMVRHSLWLILLTFFVDAAFATSGITYQGRLLKPDGTPVTSSVEFKLQIRTPGAEDCLLYEETLTQNLATTSGMFAISLGENPLYRTDAYSANWSMFDALSNRKAFTGFNGADCTGVTNYTPSASDNRVFKVSFNDGSQAPGTYENLPVQAINFVPMSVESLAVGGFKASSLLRVEQAGALVNTAPLNNAQYVELLALLAGSSNQYTRDGELNGVALPAIGSNQSVRWNAGAWQAFTPLASETDPTVQAFAKSALPICGAGTVLKSDGTSLSCVADTGGWTAVDATDTVKGIVVVPTAGGLSVAGGSLSLPDQAGVTPGSYAKVTVNAKGIITAHSSLAQSDIPQLTSAGNGVDGSAISGTIGGAVIVNTTGAITTTGTLTAGTVSTGRISSSEHRVYDLDASPADNYVSIKVPASIGANYDMVLPGVQGTSNQILGMNSAANGMEYKSITQGAGVTITHSAGGIQISAAGSGGTVTSVTGTSNQIDVDNSTPATPVVSLANLAVSPAGTYGSATQVPVVTVDAKGRVTAVTPTAIAATSPVGTALAQANIWVGNNSNVAAVVAVSGDAAMSNTGSLTITGIRGNAVQSGTPSDGQVYRYDGSGSPMFKPAYLNVQDIRSLANSAISVFPSACTSSQTMTWSALTDTFACSNISVAHTQVTGLTASNITNTPAGTIAATDVQAAINELDGDVTGLNTNKVNKNGDTMTGTLVVPSLVRAASTLPGTPAVGEIAIDSADSNKLKWYNGSGWEAASSASGTVSSVTGTANQIAVTGPANSPVIGIADLAVSPAGTYGSATQVSTVTVDAKGRVTAASSTAISGVPAANITNTPAGTVAATDVQAAINELDGDVTGLNTNKVNKNGDTMTGLLIVPEFRRTPSTLPAGIAGDIVIDSSDANKLKWHDGSGWQIVGSGSGNVSGPGASTDNAIVRFDGTTGKLIQDSAVTVGDDGSMVVTSPAAAPFSLGTTGATNPAFQIIQSGAGGGVSVTTTSSGATFTSLSSGIPNSLVMAVSGAGGEFKVQSSGQQRILSNTAGVTIGPGATSTFFSTGGNVGIGTNNPGRLLHVEGAMRVTPSVAPLSPVVGDIYIDSTDSNKLKWHDGSTWQTVATGGGTVTSVTGTANEITVGGTASAPVIGLGNLAVSPAGTHGSATQVPVITLDAKGRVTAVTPTTIAGTSPIGSTLNSGQMWVGSVGNLAAAVGMSGDATLSNTGALKVTAIQNFPITSTTPSDGQVYRYNGVGTEFRPAHLNVQDIRSVANGAVSVFPSACTSSQTMTWSALTDTFVCSAFANTPAGSIAATTVQAAINELDTEKVAKNGDTMTGTLVVPSLVRTPAVLPGVPAVGEIAIDSTDSNKLKWWNGSAWQIVGTGSGNGDIMNGGNTGAITIGTDDATSMTLETNNSPHLTILSSGDVGIGTTNPSQKLDVLGVVQAQGYYASSTSIPETSSILTLDGGLKLFRSPTAPVANNISGYVDFRDSSTDDSDARIYWDNSLNTSGAFAFSTSTDGGVNQDVRMVINNSNGNVGIGTTNPLTSLHVAKPAPAGGNQSLMILERVNSSGIPAAGEYLALQFKGPNSAGTGVLAADLGMSLTDVTPGSEKGALIFRTSANGGSTIPERMRITSSGNVGIGTTNPIEKFEVYDGHLRISNTGATPATLYLWGDRDNAVDTGEVDNVIAFRTDNIDTYGWNIDNLNSSATSDLAFRHRVAGTNYETLYLKGTATGGNVGIGTTNPGAKLHVVGEVRSTDASGAGRVWGQGRPGSVRYGTSGVGAGLCTNGATSIGLSYLAVSWEGAAAACPVGTWVCTAAERGAGACDTARPDSTVDGISANGTTLNQNANNHIGWVADVGNSTTTATAIGENGTTYNTTFPSNSYSVWCCDGP